MDTTESHDGATNTSAWMSRLLAALFLLCAGLSSAEGQQPGGAAAATAGVKARTRVVMLGTGVPLPDPDRALSAQAPSSSPSR